MINYCCRSRAVVNDLLGCLAGTGGDGRSPSSWLDSSFGCAAWPDKIPAALSATHRGESSQPQVVPGEVWAGYWEKFLHGEGCQALEQAVQVESASLEGFKSSVDVAFGDTVNGGLGSPGRVVVLDDLRGFLKPNNSHVPPFFLAGAGQGNVWSGTSVTVHKSNVLRGGNYSVCHKCREASDHRC